MRQPYKYVTAYINITTGNYRLKLTKKGMSGRNFSPYSDASVWVAIPLKSLDKLLEKVTDENRRLKEDECGI